MSDPEFIFLNGQAARITSLTSVGATGGHQLVVIARGSGDRDQLLSLLQDPGLDVRVGDEPETNMRAANIDIRSTGDGPRAVHRIQVDLIPGEPASSDATPPPATDDRLAGIEQRLDRVIELLTEIRDRG